MSSLSVLTYITHYTEIYLYTGTSSPPGTQLMTMQATDADTLFFNSIAYRLVGDSTAQRFFEVDPSSGVVSLKSVITSEKDTVYRFELVVLVSLLSDC